MKRTESSRKVIRWIHFLPLALIPVILGISNVAAIRFNISPSLPQYVFAVKKGSMPKVGDYVSIDNPYHNKRYIKRVSGFAGEEIRVEENKVFVSNRLVGTLTKTNSKGEILHPIKSQTIPAQHFFVTGDHPKSFDSKYEAFGLVPESMIEGKALPIL